MWYVNVRVLLSSVLLGVVSFGATAQNKATDMLNVADKNYQASQVKKPAAYFLDKQQAVELAKQAQWQQAKPLLEALTKQYKNDGATWYLLGLAYFNNKQWQAAVSAFERALALGYRLTGIPDGASTPNDLMVKIAEAYGFAGEQSKAIEWLNKALRARWDDKPKLAGRSLFSREPMAAFKPIENTREFKHVAGILDTQGMDRNAGWRSDLAYLYDEVQRLHVNPFHSISQADFKAQVDALDKRIPQLSDQQIVFGFMQLIGLLNNGHNILIPAWGEHGNFTQLPVQFYLFKDGLYIVAASDEYQHLIGSKVERIGKLSANKAISKVASINARDNQMQQRWLAPYYLSLVPVLQGLNIVPVQQPVTLTLTAHDKQSTVNLEARAMRFGGFPKLPPLQLGDSPTYLKNNHTPYWFEHFIEQNLLYVQVNDVRNRSDVSLAEFSAQLRDVLISKNINNLVLDLRHNSGGNGSITPPLIALTAFFEMYKPHGQLFVMVGRNTFSAGHDILVKVQAVTHPIIVGEPSGTRPNTIGESGWFNLPYSGQHGLLSSQFHQTSVPEDHRIWVAPDLPVELSAQDYFAGEDPALSAIFSLSK
ncbi:S41 family peptidase [Pseudoalteromonas sp. MMG022]|uniref:S41 family peptidase n=1 Tax=Pseudoalteromonas sp. MMG022 TaxID=2909978 RepID=UPI001F02B68D|nr:S41 family peptidase [Pseudoalteromonas sp. MMG022]MCF6437194.1 S41 family peptidase [Pseudoalteromonas sp. MMG022]